jgi:hypothetical protein
MQPPNAAGYNVMLVGRTGTVAGSRIRAASLPVHCS